MWPTDNDVKLDEFDKMQLPGQQLLAANASTPLDHVLNLDINAAPGCLRLTGIAASVGRVTYDVEIMEKLIASGMNIAVLNTVFGTIDDHINAIKMLREASKRYSTKMERYHPLAIALRLSGRKIRTGFIAQMYGDTVELRTGDIVRLTTDETYKERCSMYTVYVEFPGFGEQVKKHDIILLDNELIQLKVDMISSSTVTCKIERGGTLGNYKDVFVVDRVINMPNFSEKDKVDIDMGMRYQVDIIIASFVNSAEIVGELKEMLGEKGKRIAIVSNVQTLEGYRNYDDILRVSDGVMITRQELASDINAKKLVIAQKNMIARANKANVPIFVCAQVLSSMRYNKTAMRSEILDVANLVLDGVDVVLLSAETAIGAFPIESVAVLSLACKEAEACLWSKQIFWDLISRTELQCDQVTGTAIAAVLASHRSIAAAIVVITSTGKSAQIIAKYRPRCPIVAVTRYPKIARRLHMWRGILPLYYEGNPHPEWSVDIELRVSFCTKWAVQQGFVRVGDPIVIVSGWRQGSGFTNTMRVVYVENENVENKN